MAASCLRCFRLRMPQACVHVHTRLEPFHPRPAMHQLGCGSRNLSGHAIAAFRRVAIACALRQDADESAPALQEIQQLPSIAYGQVISAEANFVRVNISGLQDPDLVSSSSSSSSSSNSQLAERQASHFGTSSSSSSTTTTTTTSSSSSSSNGSHPQHQHQHQHQLPHSQLLCTVRALLKKMNQRVLVGDLVRVNGIDWREGRGVVEAIGPRSSELADPAIANVNHVLLLFGLTQPPFEPAQVSRFLVSVGAAGLPVTLALNKCDLLPASEVTLRLQQVAAWGYEAIAVSCDTGQGLDLLAARLAGAVSVVAGPSGAGKSSLINALRLGRHKPEAAAAAAGPIQLFPIAGELQQQQQQLSIDLEGCSSSSSSCCDSSTASTSSWEEADEETAARATTAAASDWPSSNGSSGGISSSVSSSIDESSSSSSVREQPQFLAVGDMSKIGRGKHTTRTVTLIELPFGGLMADTPGFNQPTLDRVSSNELAQLFPEFRAAVEAAGGCRFGDCMHLAEPGCAVTEGDFERYEHYIKFLAEIRAREEYDVRVMQLAKQRREGAVKVVTGRGGEARYEVRLNSKKHRATSRRRIKQSLWDQQEEQ